MENASKALLMAAGVLMGVMVLTLAVYLYASFGGSAETIQKTIEQGNIDQFNNQFNTYTGKDCTVYDIISAVNLADNYNTKNEFESTSSYYIKVFVNNKTVNGWNEETILKNLISNSDRTYSTVDESNQKYELLKYTCNVGHSELTGKVNEVKFSSK